MRFLDANIFIYAYYKPKRELSHTEKSMKRLSQEILIDVNAGKLEVLTTVVHLSEVANILKHNLPTETLARVLMDMFMLENVDIADVTKTDYLAAIELGAELQRDPNDALAIQLMQSNKINEIYSFDKTFEKVVGIKRIPSI